MEERRLLIAVVLSVAILIAWQLFFPPEKPKQESVTKQTRVERPASVGQTQTAATKPATRETPLSNVPSTGARNLSSADLEMVASHGPQEIQIETDLYKCVISANGGGIKTFELKKFHAKPDPKSPPVEMVSASLPDYMRPLTSIMNIGDQSLPVSSFYSANTDRIDLSANNAASSADLILTLATRSGLTVTRKYSIRRGSYDIGMEILVAEVPQGTTEISLPKVMPVETTIRWSAVVDQSKAKSRFLFYGIVVRGDNKYDSKRVADIRKKGPFRFNNVDWAGFAEDYFLSVLVPNNMQAKQFEAADEGSDTEQTVTANLTLPAGEVGIGKPFKQNLTIYIGPKDQQMLTALGKNMEDAIGYGRLKAFILPLLWILRQSYRIVDNWGMAIILLTVLVKIVFFPLTYKSFQQMKALQALQPRLKEIQQKYKDDREKLNTELMTLYRSNKVNPLGGCLPMLLQLPVLYALYRALYVSIELRHAPFVWWIKDLSSPERLFTLPIMGGVDVGIMPLLMGASMYVQQKMTPTTVTDPIQAKMFMTMPIIFTFMSFGFPSGLVLYWFVSNLLTIIQQYVINRRGT